MPEYSVAVRWLKLVACLQRVGRDGYGWPAALANLRAVMNCPAVFDSGLAGKKSIHPQAEARRLAALAHACASRCAGTCGKAPTANEAKRQACLAVAGVIEQAAAEGARTGAMVLAQHAMVDGLPAAPAWTPRQRELAVLLRAGATLSEAARVMGIARRTVIEHQRGLFALSSTRRLVDLVVWLRALPPP